VTRGNIHQYLGITIDFSTKGEVRLDMSEYIDEILADAPDEIMKGPATTPAANHLFDVNKNAEKLDE
jgi:hypothetical protein